MKRIAAIGPLGVLIVTGAQAQTNPFTVRGGYSYAYEKSGSGAGAASGYTFGLGWDFMELKASHTRISLDADYTNNNLRGDKIETASLQVVGRMPLWEMHKMRIYGGLGLGAYQTIVSTSTSTFTGSETIISGASNQQSSFGGELVLGCRIDEHWGLEAFWRLTQVNEGVNPNTLGIVAAFHF